MIALQIVRVPTGTFATDYDRQGQLVKREWFRIEWRPLGPAKDMADAKAKYGGSPVLEVAR